jgi:hypothetical protein
LLLAAFAVILSAVKDPDELHPAKAARSLSANLSRRCLFLIVPGKMLLPPDAIGLL